MLMRVSFRLPHRLRTGQLALAVVATFVLFTGCQTPPFEHVDSACTGFNANHMPTGDPPNASTASTSSTTAASTTAASTTAASTTAAASETSSSGTSTTATGNEALIVENLNLGHREAALNRLDQAEAYYRRVLELQPDNSVANHRLAVIADKKHDYARAEHYYLTALQREPRNPDLLSDVGYSYLLQGRREDSERCLIAATRLDPAHAKALHNLSLLYASNGDYDRAFDALRRALGENEARAQIARLFPKGRPQTNDKDAMVASFQPMESSDRGPATTVDAGDVTATTTNAPTMNAPPLAPQASSSRSAGGRIPDDEINDRFAAIDRESPPVSQSTALPSAPANGAPAATSSNGTDAAPVSAVPGADPLASMPLWSPGGSSAQKGKPPSAFEFDGSQPAPAQAPQPQRPRVVATEISPVEDSSKSPMILSRRDALTAFDAELQKETAVGGGHTASNGAAAGGPLIVNGNQQISGAAANPGKPTGDGSSPPPFSATTPMQIQPRTTPMPLFEPLDDFGPGNDFGPNDKVTVPTWPGTNGQGTAPAGNSAEAGPVIHPGSPN
jgi:Flp pilus assembly protein TadD